MTAKPPATPAIRVRRIGTCPIPQSLIPNPKYYSSVLIDSHCHLADDAFVKDLREVVERAQAAGLTHALCILAAENPIEAERARELARIVARAAVRRRPASASGGTVQRPRSRGRPAGAQRHRVDSRSAGARRDRARLPLRLRAERRPAGGLPPADPPRARAGPAHHHPHARSRRRHAGHPAGRKRRLRCAA